MLDCDECDCTTDDPYNDNWSYNDGSPLCASCAAEEPCFELCVDGMAGEGCWS